MMCTRPSAARFFLPLIFLVVPPVEAQSGGSFAGTFEDDQLTLISTAEPTGKAYTGTIVRRTADGNLRYPFQAAEQGGALVGSFKAGEHTHEFRAVFENATLVLHTG